MPMYLGEASTKRRKQIIRGITIAMILSFLIAFWPEILDFFGIFNNLIQIVLGTKSLVGWATPDQLDSMLILTYSCIFGFLGVFMFWMILLAGQAILPVEGYTEAYRTAWHLLLHILGRHGQAVLIRDGEIFKTKEDTRDGPGVAVVDFNSALVLESRTAPPGEAVSYTLQEMVGLADKPENPRAAGPGVVFTRRGDKIRGAVDLRKQFRIQPGITAYTRDGIEVSSNVFSIFTIGQPADILQVTYDGEPKPENLRVVTLEPMPEEHFRVTGMADELERNDRDEIHHYFHVVLRNHLLKSYDNLPDTNTPPTFDRERVFAAVFSEARGDNETTLPWSGLPARVAASFFREMLSQVNYDQMYDVGGPDPAPLPRYKTRLRLAMRNTGILSYRLLLHSSQQPITRRKVYLRSDLNVSEIRPLVYPKILRDRGIKVLFASFGDILPMNKAIYDHRLESWKASWQRDTEFVNAEKELEAMRIRSRARALAQRDIVTSLNNILRQTEISQEVLAVRILQALETLATDSKTRDLLPGGTLDVIKSTRDWLLPGNTPPPALPQSVDGDSLI